VTTNYIELDSPPEMAMYFCRARDFGYECGLMIDGELCENFTEPDRDLVIAAFRIAHEENKLAEQEAMNRFFKRVECPPHPPKDLIVLQGGEDAGKVRCTRCDTIMLPTQLLSSNS